MKITVVSLNRFISPSGVCVSVCNYVKCLENIVAVESINLVIGKWQTDYFVNTLQILENRKVCIVAIDIPNNSFYRNKWFFWDLKSVANSSDLLILGYPIPAMGLKVPSVTILHDLYPFDYPTNFGFPNVFFNQFIFFVNMLITDAYWCVSDFTKQSLIKRFARMLKRKIIDQLYNYVPSRSLDVTANPYPFEYWLSVAQHRKNKNLDIVIKAFAIFVNKNPDLDSLKLMILGSVGPETEKLKSLIYNFQLEGRISFLNNLSNEALTILYQHSSLTINASSIEGFGLPLVEACYYGKRIIATDIPVYHELVSGVPTFSLKGDSVVNLLFTIQNTLKLSSITPILNKNLSETKISEKIERLLQQVLNKKTGS